VLTYQASADAAFATLRTAPSGLSPAEAAARRVEYGPNRIQRTDAGAVRILLGLQIGLEDWL